MWLTLNKIYNLLSRCGTARGSGAGLCLISPTKVKAGKSSLLREGFPEVENKQVFFIFNN